MSQTIDNKIVSMEFDNKNFETNVQTSLKTLDKLKSALRFENSAQPLEKIGAAAKVTARDMEPLGQVADKVKLKFSALYYETERAYAMVSNSVKRLIKSMSVDQITGGWNKYLQKTSSVQTIINATGKSVQEVNHYLDKLMKFSDETSYNFTDMTSSLAQLLTTGGDIDKLIPMIEGIANATAYAGKTSTEFSRAIYNLNQSYSSGALKYIDWKSLEMAGVASKELKQTLIDAGVALGTIAENEVTVANFGQTLQKGWATTDVMEMAFGRFAQFSDAVITEIQNGTFSTAEEAIEAMAGGFDELAEKAFLAAQKAKTFEEAIESTKDAVSSKWMTAFELIFGNFNEASALWTDLSISLYDIFASSWDDSTDDLGNRIDGRLTRIRKVTKSNFAKIEDDLAESGVSIEDFEEKVKHYAEVFGYDIDGLIKHYGSLEYVFTSGILKPRIVDLALRDMSRLTDGVSEFENTLSRGDTGEEVEKLQKYLVSMGYELSKYGIDGKFGKETQAALKAFQEASGLEVTGIFDDATIAKINEASGGLVSYSTELKNLVNDVNKMGGREMLIKGVTNIFKAIGSVVGPVKEAFSSVFTISPEGLIKTLEVFEKFTSSLILTDDTTEAIRATFAGIFDLVGSIFDITKMVGRTLFSILGVSMKTITGTVKMVFSAISTVTSSFTKFRKWLNEVSGIPQLFSTIGTKINQIGTAIWGALTTIYDGSILSTFIKNITDTLSGLGSWITEKVTWLTDKISNIDPAQVVSWIVMLPAIVSKAIKSIDFNGLFKWVKGLPEKIGNFFKGFNLWDWLTKSKKTDEQGFTLITKNWFGKLVDWIVKQYESAKEWISGFDFSPLWNWISDIPGKIKEWFTNLDLSPIKNWFTALPGKISEWVKDFKFSDIWKWLTTSSNTDDQGFTLVTKNWFGKLVEWITGVYTSFKDWVSNIDWGSVWTSIVNAFNDAVTWFKSIDLTPVWDWIKSIPGKIWKWLTTSTETDEQGFTIITKTWFGKIWDKIVKAFSSINIDFGAIWEWIKAIPQKIVSFFSEDGVINLDSIWDWIKSIPSKIAEWFSNLSLDGIITGVKNFFKKIKAFFANIFETLGKAQQFSVGGIFLDIVKTILTKIKDLIPVLLALAPIVTLIVTVTKLLYFIREIGQFATVLNKKVVNKGAVANWADFFKSMALLVAAVTASIFVLGKMKTGEIVQGIVAITAILGVITAFNLLNKKLNEGGKGNKGLDKIGLNMLAIAAALMALVVAMRLMRFVKWSDMAKTGATLIGFIGIMVATSHLLSKNSASMDKLGLQMLSMSAALLVLAIAMKAFGLVKWSEMLKAAVALGGMLVAFIATAKLVSKGNKDIAQLGLFALGLSASLLLLVGSVFLLGKMSGKTLAKGITAVALLAVLLAGVTKLADSTKTKSKSLFQNIATMATIAISVGLLAGAIYALSSLDSVKMATAAASLGIVMAAVALMLKYVKTISVADVGTLALLALIPAVLGGIFLGFMSLVDTKKIDYKVVAATLAGMSTLMLSLAGFMAVFSTINKPGIAVFDSNYSFKPLLKFLTITLIAVIAALAVAWGAIEIATARMPKWGKAINQFLTDVLAPIKNLMFGVDNTIGRSLNDEEQKRLLDAIKAVGDLMSGVGEAITGMALFTLFSGNRINDTINTFTRFITGILPAVSRAIKVVSSIDDSDFDINKVNSISNLLGSLASIASSIPSKIGFTAIGGGGIRGLRGLGGYIDLTVTPMITEFGTLVKTVFPEITALLNNNKINNINTTDINNLSTIADVVVKLAQAVSSVPFKLNAVVGGAKVKNKFGIGGILVANYVPMMTEFTDFATSMLTAMTAQITAVKDAGVVKKDVEVFEGIIDAVVALMEAVDSIPYRLNMHGIGGRAGKRLGLLLAGGNLTIESMLPEFSKMVQDILPVLTTEISNVKSNGITSSDVDIFSGLVQNVVTFAQIMNDLPKKLFVAAGGLGVRHGLLFGGAYVNYAADVTGLVKLITSLSEPIKKLTTDLKTDTFDQEGLNRLTTYANVIKLFGEGYGAMGTVMNATVVALGGGANKMLSAGGGGLLSVDVNTVKDITGLVTLITKINEPIKTLATELRDIDDPGNNAFDRLEVVGRVIRDLLTGIGSMGSQTEVHGWLLGGGAGGVGRDENGWSLKGIGGVFGKYDYSESIDFDGVVSFIEAVVPQINTLATTVQDLDLSENDMSALTTIGSVIRNILTGTGDMASAVEGDAWGLFGGKVGKLPFIGFAKGGYKSTPMLDEVTKWLTGDEKTDGMIKVIKDFVLALSDVPYDSGVGAKLTSVGEFIRSVCEASGLIPSKEYVTKTVDVLAGLWTSTETTITSTLFTEFTQWISDVKQPLVDLINAIIDIEGLDNNTAVVKMTAIGKFIGALATAAGDMPVLEKTAGGAYTAEMTSTINELITFVKTILGDDTITQIEKMGNLDVNPRILASVTATMNSIFDLYNRLADSVDSLQIDNTTINSTIQAMKTAILGDDSEGVEGMLSVAETMSDEIKGTNFNGTSLEQITSLMTAISNFFAISVDIVKYVTSQTFKNTAPEAFRTLGEAVGNFITMATENGGDIDEAIKAADAAYTLSKSIKTLSQAEWSNLETNIDTDMFNQIAEAMKNIKGSVTDYSGAYSLTDVINSISNSKFNGLYDAFDAIKYFSNVGDYSSTLADTSNNIITTFGKSLLTAVNSQNIGFEGIINAIMNGLRGNIVQQMRNLGYEMIASLGNGIYSATYVAVAQVERLGDTVIDAIKHALKIGTNVNVKTSGDDENIDSPVVGGSITTSSLSGARISANTLSINATGLQNPGDISRILSGATNSIKSVAYAAGNSALSNSVSNRDIVAAINKLNTGVKSQNVYSVGNVTYDDGSNVALAVENLVNAVRTERRL